LIIKPPDAVDSRPPDVQAKAPAPPTTFQEIFRSSTSSVPKPVNAVTRPEPQITIPSKDSTIDALRAEIRSLKSEISDLVKRELAIQRDEIMKQVRAELTNQTSKITETLMSANPVRTERLHSMLDRLSEPPKQKMNKFGNKNMPQKPQASEMDYEPEEDLFHDEPSSPQRAPGGASSKPKDIDSSWTY
jgi:hypothetical protein